MAAMSPKRDLPLYMTAAEVESVMKYAERQRSRLPSIYGRLAILIMWRAGLRISEALALKPGHVDLDDTPPKLRVHLGKGQRTRIVPCHPELADAIRDFDRYRPSARYRPVSGVTDTGQIVLAGRTTIHRWIKAGALAAAAAGELDTGKAEKISAHTFRHSAARHWMANGIPANKVQRWLGHSDLATTNIYLELLPDPEDAMTAIP